MTQEQPPPPTAGWYPDPSGSGGERYWDGGRWTAQTRSLHVFSQSSSDRLVTWGYATALLLWPVGLVIGLILVSRERGGGGVILVALAMMALSVIYVLNGGELPKDLR